MGLLDRLRERGTRADRVAAFVDGPNVLREEFDVDLDEVREVAARYGRPAIRRVYLDEDAPSGLVRAAEARGFEVVVTSGDVDVRLAVDVVRTAVAGDADAIVVVSRDTDFKPAVEAANAEGLLTVAVAPGSYGRSDALRHAASEHLTLGE
ncbi:MAG: NYN domain-containing protein [Haloferacaceae archaeon]